MYLYPNLRLLQGLDMGVGQLKHKWQGRGCTLYGLRLLLQVLQHTENPMTRPAKIYTLIQ